MTAVSRPQAPPTPARRLARLHRQRDGATATAASPRPRVRPCRSSRVAASGFSLIELMVVMVIIVVIVAATALSLGARGFDRELDREGRRIAALLELASEEAVLQSREFGIEFLRGGYLFHVFEPAERAWLALADDTHFRARDLPDGLDVSLRVEGRRAELREAPGDTPRPQVMVLSSGEFTPFQVALTRPGRARLELESDAAGNTEITRSETDAR